MSLIMGVDGGGSKTYAVITDAHGALLGTGSSLGSNYQMIGIEQTVVHLKQAMGAALSMAGAAYDELSFVQYALAGADREPDFTALRAGLAQIPVKRWALECDTMAGLRSGSPDNVGVVLVCGSGTNAVGRSRSGKMVQTGGFGYLYGDSAGGNTMAIETFRSAVRSWEHREIDSILADKVPRFFGFDSMERMYHDFLDKHLSSVPGELTIVLHEAVDEGDALAMRILSNIGKELGLAANSVIRRIGDIGIDAVPIVLIGSVFQKGRNSHMLEALELTIRSQHPNATFVIPEMEPVFGAVLLAMDQLGIRAKTDMMNKFNAYRGAFNYG